MRACYVLTMCALMSLVFQLAECAECGCSPEVAKEKGMFIASVAEDAGTKNLMFRSINENCLPEVDVDNPENITWTRCLSCLPSNDKQEAMLVRGSNKTFALLTTGIPLDANIDASFASCSFTIKKDLSAYGVQFDENNAYVEGKLLVRKCDGEAIAGEAYLFEPTKKEMAEANILEKKLEARVKVMWSRIY